MGLATQDSGEYAEMEQQSKKLIASLTRPAAHTGQKFYGAQHCCPTLREATTTAAVCTCDTAVGNSLRKSHVLCCRNAEAAGSEKFRHVVWAR